jgi:PBSX family phage terminase large subunit
LAAKKNPLSDKAYELYKSGMKLVEIAAQLNCSDATIRTWKNRYKWDDGNETFQKENETKHNVSKGKGKKLTPKQEAFTAEYIKNGGNAVRAAKAAGYSDSTAKNASKVIVENSGVSEQIAEQMAQVEREQHRDIMSLAEIQERRSLIAKGKVEDGRGIPDFASQLKAMDGLEKALAIAEKQKREREEKEKRESAALWTIPITDITSDFVEIYRTVHEAFAGEVDVHEIVSKGGRGSIKSNFWGDLAYETIRQDPQAHIVYTRRYKVDLRGSVYNQFMKTVIRYNDLDNWDFKQSPMCAVYKPTGQTVMFVGADKPISLKSFNVPFGYVKLLIHEECDEMAGVEQMDNIEDTFLRSDTPALDIKIFNPPKSKNNFMNQYVEECKTKPQTRICHSYYYNVPVKWLGKRFFERAEWFKVHKPLYYRNNYMGEVTGTGGGIFDNVEERTITDAEIENMPFFYHGLDFGFVHPQTFQKAWYDEDTDTLYCVDEVYAKKCKNSTFARKIKKYITEEIICDSALPDAIAELQDWGFNAIGAKKRWGSGKGRDYCWEWLQQTTKIVVDPERCPHLAHELTTLEHEQLADGSFSDAYPKLGEDCVMALIYGLNRVIMESRRNNGLYDDEIDEDEEEEDEEYED